MPQTSDTPDQKHESEVKVFNNNRRVQLYYKALDYLPAPAKDGYGAGGGSGLYKLDELLRRHLGKLSLAAAREIEKRILNFILTAPEDEILTLIELIPMAYYIADKEAHSGIPYVSHFGRDLDKALTQMAEDLNGFLKLIGSPARFMPDGSFNRNGMVMEAPMNVEELPHKEDLIRDISALMGKESFGVIFIDLDHFKRVNDEQGHAAGNHCLEHVVEIIGAVLLFKGRLYRYGGDEFIAVIRNSTMSETVATAERIRKEIEIGNPGGSIPVTASVGVASSDCAGLAQTQLLIEAADQAMYQSKNSGRNRVTAWARAGEEDTS